MRGLASLVTCLANLLIVFSSRVLISHTELGPIEDFIADKRLSVGELFDLATLDLADQPPTCPRALNQPPCFGAD